MFTMNKTTHDMTITCNFNDYDIAHRLKPIVRCGYIVNFKICTNKHSQCNVHIQKNYITDFGPSLYGPVK